MNCIALKPVYLPLKMPTLNESCYTRKFSISVDTMVYTAMLFGISFGKK